jgi:hypothetical protein
MMWECFLGVDLVLRSAVLIIVRGNAGAYYIDRMR